MSQELFYKDEDGNIKPDKRASSSKIETTLAKVALSQDMVESTIKNIERTQSANNTMMENLIRSEYRNIKNELENHNTVNENAIHMQGRINNGLRENIKQILSRLKKHDEQILGLQSKPIKNKADVVDTIVKIVIGGIGALILSYVINIFNVLFKGGL